jgi:hypothetical protein
MARMRVGGGDRFSPILNDGTRWKWLHFNIPAALLLGKETCGIEQEMSGPHSRSERLGKAKMSLFTSGNQTAVTC